MVNKAWREMWRRMRKRIQEFFYAHLKGERANRQRVGPLKDDEGRLVVEPKKQAEMLNQYFASVFTSHEGVELPEKERMEMKENVLDEIEFSGKRIEEKIIEMKANSAPGPEGIMPQILKEVAKELCKPLVFLFTKINERR
jgi:hypothetical protein